MECLKTEVTCICYQNKIYWIQDQMDPQQELVSRIRNRVTVGKLRAIECSVKITQNKIKFWREFIEIPFLLNSLSIAEMPAKPINKSSA
jgi:hypothetical protein